LRPLPATCSEQGKLPAAKAFTLAEERDKTMSEQKINYMAELDAWTESNVLAPLLWTGEDGESEDLSDDTLERVKHDIREKVRESYKNGLRSGAGAVRKEQRYAQAKTR
jgi:hypothetical protein